MADATAVPPAMDEFFRRWEGSGAAERANYSMFLNELCDLLEVPRPDPAGPDDEKNVYVFERMSRSPIRMDRPLSSGLTSTSATASCSRPKQGSEKAVESDAFALAAPKRMRRGTAVRGTAGWDAAPGGRQAAVRVSWPGGHRAPHDGRTDSVACDTWKTAAKSKQGNDGAVVLERSCRVPSLMFGAETAANSQSTYFASLTKANTRALCCFIHVASGQALPSMSS